MQNPFENNEDAFSPFYTEWVVLHFKDGKTQSVKACIFSDGTSEAIDQTSIDTSMEEIQLAFRTQDIAYLQALTRGDKIERSCMGKKYKIVTSEKDAFWNWIIRARSI